MKKIIFFAVTLIATTFAAITANAQTSVWDGSHTTWTTGTGTQNDPYLIESAAQLAHLAYIVNNGTGQIIGANTYWKLMVDINLNGNNTFQWVPIGNNNAFGGNFDGNNHKIYNLYINSNTLQIAGLFGYISGASISNTGIESNCSLIFKTNIPGNKYIGGIAAYAGTNSKITNCYNKGKISDSIHADSTNSYLGGIIGYSNDIITIVNCYNMGIVSSTTIGGYAYMYTSRKKYYTGGIIGCSLDSSKIINCYNTGGISSTVTLPSHYLNSYSSYSYSGGIAGQGSNIIECHNTGNVSSVATTFHYSSSSNPCYYSYLYSGGIIGQGLGTTVTNCYNTSNVSSAITSAEYSSSLSSFVPYSYSGGIVGEGSNITNCYNTGDISASATNYSSNYYYFASSHSGGIIGQGTNVTNSYNRGGISSSSYNFSGYPSYSYVGGIIGKGSIATNCYSTGYISSSGSYYSVNQGGVIGSGSTCNNSYYYRYYQNIGSLGEPKTAEFMKTAEFVSLLNLGTFAFRLDINNSNNDYPVLLPALQGFEIKTATASNITQTRATFKGSITTGNVNIISKGFQYKISNDTMFNVININNSNDTLIYNATNLRQNKNYQYRIFAVNSDNDTAYGEVKSFTTLPIIVTTLNATNITQTKSTLNGKMLLGDATATTKGFEYKLPTESNYIRINVSGNDTNITNAITNLLPNKAYNSRTFAIYLGDTLYGEVKNFTTLPVTVTTLDAANITHTKAILNGKVIFGDATVTKGFEYKLSTEQTYISVNIYGNDTNITHLLTNLLPNKTYQYRTFSTCNGNTVYGSVKNFTTLDVTATTNTATNITRSTVTLNGTTFFGDATVIEQGFVLRKQGGNTDTFSVSTSNSTLVYNATNLFYATTYYVKAFCKTMDGIFYGAEKQFTTLAFNQNGTSNMIENIDDLLLLARLVEEGNSFVGQKFILMNDINLPNTPNNINSIGRYENYRPFCGEFDGNAKRIYNVYIDYPNTPYQGFFGYTKNADIHNLGLVNITASGRNYTGGMVAYAENTKITDCYVNGGTLFALSYCGGLVGYQTQGTNSIITSCYNTCTVTGNNYVGGLLGYSNQGTVRNSYVAALVTGQSFTTGAIIGGAMDVLMYNCYFNDSITGQSFAIGENNMSKSGKKNTKSDENSMSSNEMRMQDFVNTLNQGLITPVWKMDYTQPINNGFPILNWQTNQTVGVSTVETENNNIELYPNPVRDNLTINLGNVIKGKVIIYNTLGSIVFSQAINGNKAIINMASLPKGFYNVVIVANGKTIVVKKIVKQ